MRLHVHGTRLEDWVPESAFPRLLSTVPDPEAKSFSACLQSAENRLSVTEFDLIIAGASVRSLAQSAIRDGLRPLCVDQFGDADLRGLLQKLRGSVDNFRRIQTYSEVPEAVADVSANVPVIVAGGLESNIGVITQLRGQRPVLTSPDRVMRQLTDPDSLFPVLVEAGCEVPRYLSNRRSDRRGLLSAQEAMQIRWLSKTTDGSGGLGVTFAAPAAAEWPSTEDKYYQEFIDGIPLSATFYRAGPQSAQAAGSLELLGCALQLSGCSELNAPGFAYCGNAGPVLVSGNLQKRLEKIGECIAEHWAIRGLVGVDVVVRDGRPYVVEVNPRLTASHELHELRRPSLLGHISMQIAAFAENDVKTRTRSAGSNGSEPLIRCVVYAASGFRMTADQEAAMLSLWRDPVTKVRNIWLADIPAAGSRVDQGTPFCSIYLPLNKELASDMVQETLKPVFGAAESAAIDSLRCQIQANFDDLTSHKKKPG